MCVWGGGGGGGGEGGWKINYPSSQPTMSICDWVFRTSKFVRLEVLGCFKPDRYLVFHLVHW